MFSVVGRSYTASLRYRWWSSVVLVVAFAPIIALYLIWLPLTCMGKVKAADVPENEEFGRTTVTLEGDNTVKKTVNPLVRTDAEV